MNFSLVGASLNAYGHPGACSEPAPGTVEGSTTVSVNGVDIAAKNACNLHFPSHGHAVDEEGNCISFSSHSIQPIVVSESVSIDGEQIYVETDGAATDPGSGGTVDYINSGGNKTVHFK